MPGRFHHCWGPLLDTPATGAEATEAPITLRPPYTRGAFVAAVIWSLRVVLSVNLWCFFLWLAGASGPGGTPSFAAIVGSVGGASLLMWLLVMPRRRRARNECSIIFLRGFRQEARADVPNRVLPCIGCYGRIMRLRNVVKTGTQDQIAGLNGESMTDTREQPYVRDDWKPVLLALLQQADLAVIDFSVSSESLFWEIEQCLRRLPAQRIVLITELSEYAKENHSELCGRFPDLLYAPAPIPVYPSRFLIPLRFWRWWFFEYERRVDHCMKAIAAQSLQTALLASDWHGPSGQAKSTVAS
ncbi:hypothetical protein ACVW17_006265 [Bradyrhizobium sp. USDA 4473]